MKPTSVMRVLLSLLMIVFGANRLMHFIPEPPWPHEAAEFLGALDRTGYMMPLIGLIDVVTGSLLLGNRYVPLALAVMLPILVNAVLFHIVLAPGTMLFAVLALGLNLALLACHRRTFHVLFAWKPISPKAVGVTSLNPS